MQTQFSLNPNNNNVLKKKPLEIAVLSLKASENMVLPVLYRHEIAQLVYACNFNPQ